MRRASALSFVIALAGLAACSGSGHQPAPTASTRPPAALGAGGSPTAGQVCTPERFHLEPQRFADRQAAALVARMSLAQQISMMHGVGLAGANGAAGSTTPIPALGIRALNQQDGPGGVGDGDTGVTQLPAPVALAATFDPAAARCYGQVIGQEMRGKGIELAYGPTVNLVRQPLWGRAFESLGEDPVLSGTIAKAEIDGTQGAGVMAEAKHFAVYNQETNRNTPQDNAIVSERVLQELYLRVWSIVASAHPAAVMCAYSTINSQPACQDRALIRGFLDRQPGFHGFVAADFNATHSTVPAANAGLDQEQPAGHYFGRRLLTAVQAGRVPRQVVAQAATRVVAQMFRFGLFSNYPEADAHANVTTAAHFDVARAIAAEGTVLLKNDHDALPLPRQGSIAVIGPAATTDTADSGGGTAHVVSPGTVSPLQGVRALAPDGVDVSYTQGLPAAAGLTAIPGRVLHPAYPADGAPSAYTARLTPPQTGTYVFGLTSSQYYTPESLSIDGHPLLSDPAFPATGRYTVSTRLVAGRTYRLSISGPSASLTWAAPQALQPQIAAAAAAAAKASAAVVVVADPQQSEITDRVSLQLPNAQDDLIAAVAKANPRTVVVVESGGPVAMPWLHRVAAVLDQWYPGQADGLALADVLFGGVNPSGHLPVTFPRSLADTAAATPRQFPGRGGRVIYSEGLKVGYRADARPLFPFGYGLSYTSFTYATPKVSVRFHGLHPVVTVTDVVTNAGDRPGADVAQLYLGIPIAGEPSRQLEAYQRVDLPAGHSTRVTFRLQGQQLAAFTHGHWQTPRGPFRAYVGDSSALAQLSQAPVFALGEAGAGR